MSEREKIVAGFIDWNSLRDFTLTVFPTLDNLTTFMQGAVIGAMEVDRYEYEGRVLSHGELLDYCQKLVSMANNWGFEK